MGDQALPIGQPARDPASETDSLALESPSRLTRYERRSGSLPHLEDQPGVRDTRIDLPTPVASRLRPLDRLRSLISS